LFADNTKVPALGNVMASRWAYEAMAVHQFVANEYAKQVYDLEKDMEESKFIFDVYFQSSSKNRLELQLNGLANRYDEWEPLDPKDREVHSVLREFSWLIERGESQISRVLQRKDTLFTGIVKYEILKDCLAQSKYGIPNYMELDGLSLQNARKTNSVLTSIFKDLSNHQREVFNRTNAMLSGTDIKEAHSNGELRSFVTGSKSRFEGVDSEKSFFRGFGINYSQAFITPKKSALLSSHFYAPVKHLLYREINTSAANLLVIWFMTMLLGILLYFDGLKRLLDIPLGEWFGKK
jgi:ABC transport system ATP-binding/permease protein